MKGGTLLMSSEWCVSYPLPDGSVHVWPMDDEKEHFLTEVCLCVPFRDGKNVVHNSFDGREAFERVRGVQ